MSTTVTSKGQVTIPKKVREYLGIEAGTEIDFDHRRRGEAIAAAHPR
jgi:AbrB family looped-hinge helix DNA binding protein